MKPLQLTRSSERRFLVFSLVLMLLLGAAVNVPFAVTRFPSRTGPQPPQLAYITDPVKAGPKGWVTSTPHEQDWPAPTSWRYSSRFGLRAYDIRWNNPDPDANGFQLDLARMGWPLPVIELKQMWWDWDNPALDGPESDPRPHLLPLGLVANPMLVGVPIWLVLVVVPIGLVMLRRAWRARGGDCPWCGYERGLAACPECGPQSSGFSHSAR